MSLPPSPAAAGILGHARHCAENGRIKNARIAYRRALKQDPRNAEILSELGAVEARAGNIGAARKAMEKAVRLAPRDSAVHFNLGELERQARRHAQAEKHFRTAISLAPDDADALLGLGVSLLMRKNPEEAIEVLERARGRAPRDTGILNQLGNALAAVSRHEEAAAVYRQALGIAPDYHDALYNLALCLSDLKQYEPANALFGKADRTSPIEDRLAWKWAQTQARCGEHEQAIANATRSIDADGPVPQAYFIRGIAHQYLGDFDSAERDLRKAISLGAGVAEAYEKLALIKRLTLDDAEVIENVMADPDMYRNSTRASAGFTLYRLYDGAGDRENAFRALSEANRLKARDEPFEADSHRAATGRLAEIFDESFFETRQGEGIGSESPVFILGMPRSGTTLTEQILAAYPEVHPGGERLVIQEFTRTVAGYPETLPGMNAGRVRDHAGALLSKLRAGAGGKRFATDKTPGNYANIGLISWFFPNAKVIYCKRDPRDIGFSCFEQNFDAGLSFSYDLDAFVVAYECHVRMMKHWKRAAPLEICEIEYEKLVREPEREAKKLVAFCGLQWDDLCLDTTRVNRPVQTASFWQVRQPIHTASVGKWRRYEDYLTSFAGALDKL